MCRVVALTVISLFTHVHTFKMMALARPVPPVGCQPPAVTNKMLKMLQGFLKKQSQPKSRMAEEMQSSTIENALSKEYGVSFHAMERTSLSSEFKRRPADQLLKAVKELQAGNAGRGDPGVMADAFATAYGLMEATDPVQQINGIGELEFRTAQAILLQLALLLSGNTAVTPGMYYIDEQRVIRVVWWVSTLLAVPAYFGEALQVSEPREYALFPKPDPCRYRGTITVTSVNGIGGQEFFCEGAHIIISCVHPHIDMASQQEYHVNVNRPQQAELLLSWFIAAPSPTDINRYLAAADRKQPVVFLRRNLGLTHPAAPFHESNSVVFLDSNDDVEQVLQLADHAPCGLSRHFLDYQTGMIPFTFPPAIDDWDQRMQSSMMQIGSPFGDEAEAASYFCQKLEDAALDISQLEEEVKDLPVEDEDDIMTKAKRLARDALLCLQRHHVAVRWVSEILQDTIEIAVYQGRIKQEQEQISNRWEVQPKPTKQNRHAAKRERKKQGQNLPTDVKVQPVQSPSQRLRSILNDFTNKVFKYQHYKKAFHALQSTGLLAHVGCESIRGSHHVLHAHGAASATVVMPHGSSSEHHRHRFARSLMNIAAQTQAAV
ncbi:unnamed protein product [Symbiodinium sp. CCMP2592]|nr:unnamed protein product [Symbiodinium sp. CCMP2592]